MTWLRRRQGLLDGVVFSGGEPTAQPSLRSAIAQVRELGFETALHTSGIYPARLAEVLPSLDWIGLDIKAPFDQYTRITGIQKSGAKARLALESVLGNGLTYELRTTVHPLILTQDHLIAIACELHSYGVQHWVLQEFRSQGCADMALAKSASRLDLALVVRLQELVPHITIRAAT